MKAHHLYSTATTLAAAVLLAAPSLADQTISDAQTKAVNMTEGKLTVTGTGFLNVAKNAVNLKDPIQSALEIEVMEGGRISGKSALVLDQDMENGITGQLISVTNSGTMTGTEKQAIDLRYTPELQFFMDDSIAHGAHILDLLNHVKPANPANADIVLPEDRE